MSHWQAPEQALSGFRLRLGLALGAILTACGLLAGRFFYLQVTQFSTFHTQAEANRISIVPVAPNRGLIMDRNQTVLAHNYSAYTLEIVPSKAGKLEETIDRLSEVVEITAKDRKRFRKLLEESRNFESLPIKNRLTEEQVARFAVNRYRFPGVEIKARLFREYPHGRLASHALGYIGRINQADLDRLEADGQLANYKGTDHVGKLGLEASYERELHGTAGFERIETDAAGRGVRVLSRTDPIAGNDLIVSLDLGLQQVAEQAFGDRRGALVAIEPASGEVLAFVSQPGLDPNLFVDGIDQANWEGLNGDPDQPLNNRALRGLYPPGSTLKPYLALAALELGKRTPGYAIFDPGYFDFGNHRFRDDKPGGHGTVDLYKSIVASCDTYYYRLANDMGIEAMAGFLERFGFGQRTGIDLPNEVAGVLPSPQWKERRFKQRWFPGETISVGIGQGYNAYTPLQLAQAIATIANDGVMMRPRLVAAVRDSRTQEVRRIPSQRSRDLGLKPEHLRTVQAALIGVNREGTSAKAFAGAAYVAAGKTGTAQVVAIRQNERYVESRVAERHRDHALYVAYAPAEAPRIALAVLVENGGFGAMAAAPIARQVLDYYLTGRRSSEPAAEMQEEDGSD